MKIKIGPYSNKTNRRKIKIHIDRYDTWSMDHTLAMIIYPMLLQLKDTKQGIPADFAAVGGEDYVSQQSFDFYKESYNESFDISCKKYEEILDKMIWSFQQIAEDNWEENYYHGKAEYDWVETEPMLNPNTNVIEPMYQMVDKNPGEHWVDYEGMRLHQERIQEGLDLFAKYFTSLWD